MADPDADELPGPLTGLLVLDFSRVLSGPIAGRALTDLGADVVKIEPPQGDLSRFAYPKVNSLALYYVQQNVGKRNISLDLNQPEAADAPASAGRTRPTSCSRTSGPASWPGSVSTKRRCGRTTRG